MVVVIFEDLSMYSEVAGGYYNPALGEVHVDSTISSDQQMEVLIHEALESCLYQQFSHSFIEELTNEIYSVMKVLKEEKKWY